MSNILKIAGAGVSAAAEETDANFNQTVLLLHGDGTNGAQNNTFLDSGTANSGSGFTITRNPASGPNAPTQGTFSPFSAPDGRWSNYFDGATATRLTLASSTDFAFGTGAYTMEAFVYLSQYGSQTSSVFTTGSANNSIIFGIGTSGQLILGKYGVGDQITSSTGSVEINKWVHIAIVRTSTASNDTRLYVNGSVVQTGTDNNDWTVTTTPTIGGLNLSGYTVNGYVANLRVIKGTAVTPPSGGPTSPFSTSTSNQVLLACYGNRFADFNTATTAKTITVNGNPKVTPFSPYAPSAAWSASVNGGSGYFDGTGDELSAAQDTAFNLGTGAFAVEGWFYINAFATGANRLIGLGLGASGGAIKRYTGWTVNYSPTYVNFYRYSGTEVNRSASVTMTTGQWYHYVACRDASSNFAIFLNGTRVYDAASATTAYDNVNSDALYVARLDTGDPPTQRYSNAYFSDIRVVKGSTPYDPTDTSIPVPTAPSTNITNTSLLLNFTNAGIFDQTGKNNLETVADAQIDTTTKKYGTGSMEFDGTGDWLQLRNTEDFVFGTGDFTIEMWVNPSGGLGTDSRALYDARPVSTNGLYPSIFIQNTTPVITYSTDSAVKITGTTSLSTGTWYHIAICRASGSTKLFVNGVQEGSTYSDTNNYLCGANSPVIGTNGFTRGSSPYQGYIDDLRITKGVARYTSNFTAPTKAYPDL